MWAASCGLACTGTLDKWLPGLSGERREFGARLLQRACVIEARRLLSLAVREFQRCGVPCGRRLQGEKIDVVADAREQVATAEQGGDNKVDE